MPQFSEKSSYAICSSVITLAHVFSDTESADITRSNANNLWMMREGKKIERCMTHMYVPGTIVGILLYQPYFTTHGASRVCTYMYMISLSLSIVVLYSAPLLTEPHASPIGPFPPNYGTCISVISIITESPIDTEELHIRPDDYIQVNFQKNELHEAFAGDNVSVEFDEDKEDVATQKVQLTMPGEYLN